MCGIVGYIGKKYNCIEVLIKGLTSLEYRGYDSAGIAYLKDNKIKYSMLCLLEKIKDRIYSYNTFGYIEDLEDISS